jgi:hypothetical protein
MQQEGCVSRLSAPAGLLALAILAPAAEKKVTFSDCRYSLDPSEFLSRAARERRQVLARSVAFGTALGGARSYTVAPSEIAQRNFIDQEIFGGLIRSGAASAPLAADEEFFRRIHLDLTGRLPEPDAIREFLAGKSESKRDRIIDALLASPEFTDRWTLWMGDWLQNTTRLANAAANRNAQGRNAFHAYIRAAVAEDRPLRSIAIETVTAPATTTKTRAAPRTFLWAPARRWGPCRTCTTRCSSGLRPLFSGSVITIAFFATTDAAA